MIQTIEVTVGDETGLSAMVEVVERVAECFRDVVRFGGYPAIPADAEQVVLDVARSRRSAAGLTLSSPLFQLDRTAMRHVSAAIRYECLRHGLQASIEQYSLDHWEPGESRAQAQLFSRMPGIVPFETDVSWGYHQLSLELDFAGEIVPQLVQSSIRRVALWATFAKLGAYCTDEQFAVPDEELDAGLYLDTPSVGFDFMVWTMTCINVPVEAAETLMGMIGLLNNGRRLVTGVVIG